MDCTFSCNREEFVVNVHTIFLFLQPYISVLPLLQSGLKTWEAEIYLVAWEHVVALVKIMVQTPIFFYRIWHYG